MRQSEVELPTSGIGEGDVEETPYAEYVVECVDNLIQHGTVGYGENSLPLLVTYLDVHSRQCPKEVPTQNPYWRGQNRECFWKPRGADLFTDQSTIEVMYLLSKLTGDEKYGEFADSYLKCATSMVDDKGFFWWGWHRFYDAFEGKRCCPNGDHHEIHVNRPRWEELFRANEKGTLRELEAIWQWHVCDKETGEHNRHGNGHSGCDFAMSGGEFVYALTFLHSKTGDETYLRGARLVSDYHWRHRDSKTGLTPNRPNAGVERFDGCHFDTSITGIHCYFLLRSYDEFGVEEFRDKAIDYLHAYGKYGYDNQAGKFWGSLRLDGTPEDGVRGGDGYSQYEPRGHIDLWQPYQLGYEFPIYTAQIYAYAYHITADDGMLDIARKWAHCIHAHPPSAGCEFDPTSPGYEKLYSKLGTFAGHYGRTISFFVHMYAITGEEPYLNAARRIAQEAVSKLYYKGLFRGHPAKPYYGSVDGVGFLLYGLLQLHCILQDEDNVKKMTSLQIPGDKSAVVSFDNW